MPETRTGVRRFDGRWSITKPRWRSCCDVCQKTLMRVRGRYEGWGVIRVHRRKPDTMAVAAAAVVIVAMVEAVVVAW